MFRNILAPIFVSALFLFSCNKASKEHSGNQDSVLIKPRIDSAENANKISPPFEGINVEYQSFKVNPKQGATLTNKNGTKISIPANALVNKDGSALEEDVEIQYREFRDLDELLVSGIPMTYHHDGRKENFISAGMFELKGQTVSGTEIEIGANQRIEVNMASATASTAEGVNFYFLNQQTTEWEVLASSSRKSITRERKAVQNNNPLTSVEVKTNDIAVSKADKAAYKFELDLDCSKVAELKDYKDVIWQYVPQEGYDNPETFEGFNVEKWTSAKVNRFDLAKKLYLIELGSKTKNFKALVTPVVGEKAYKKAMEQALAHTKSYRDRVKEVDAYINQTAMISSQIASVSQFGIYNHDIFYKGEQQLVTNLKLKLPKNQKMEFTRVFLVMKGAKGIIEYSENGYDMLSQFTFNPKDQNGLIVVYPHNKVSVVYNKDFKKLNFSQKTTELDLSSETNVKNFETLRNIIQNI